MTHLLGGTHGYWYHTGSVPPPSMTHALRRFIRRSVMKAAVLKNFGSPLVIEDVACATRGTGEVIVDVVAAPVLSYAGEVFSGERKYLLPTPVVPGCGAIGRVRDVGP